MIGYIYGYMGLLMAGYLPTHLNLVRHVGLWWTSGAGDAKSATWTATSDDVRDRFVSNMKQMSYLVHIYYIYILYIYLYMNMMLQHTVIYIDIVILIQSILYCTHSKWSMRELAKWWEQLAIASTEDLGKVRRDPGREQAQGLASLCFPCQKRGWNSSMGW